MNTPASAQVTSSYNQGGDRSLISVLMPQGHRIVWNWNNNAWDEMTIEEYNKLRDIP